MLNRIRASVAGGESIPDSPPSRRSTASHNNSHHHPVQNSPSTPQRGGGLFGFLNKQSSTGSNQYSPTQPHNHNHDKGITPMGPSTGGFFGGLIGGGGGGNQSPVQPPSPNVEADSPRTIRASAAALLKFSTTPPLFNASDSSPSRSNNNNTANNNNNTTTKNRAEALEEQINQRDRHIMKLEHDLTKLTSQHQQLTKDTTTLRRQHLESSHRHTIALRLWNRTNDGLKARVDCFERECAPSAAKEIAALIRDAAPSNKDSAYLMMLQDQLGKATYKLDHLSSQTDIVLHKGEEVVESLREEMNEVIRERCRMEIELLDQEYLLEREMKLLVGRTERRLKRVLGEIDFLERNAVLALKCQDDDEGSVDEGEENDEEEKGEGVDDVTEGTTQQRQDDDDKEEDDKDTNTTTAEVNKEDTDGTTDQQHEEEQEEDTNSTTESGKENNNNNKTKNKQQEEETPEVLRQKLRKIAMERDRSLNLLQKKLRDKNEEYTTLMKLKERRTLAIEKIEVERREREEWERGRREVIA